jgi:crotonobetainyl-CoA:carnitine CoA-transferase CaiB-like acyl-CoA transferase
MAVRGLVEFVDHPAEGRIPQLVNPLAKAGLADTRRRPAPGLGENGDDVLAELDYSEEERERLRETGVIGS